MSILNRKLKVLMFGWEFPPMVAGGLGMACYGLVKALLKKGDVDITLILPKNISSSKEEGLTIFGADYWEFSLSNQVIKINGVKTIRLKSDIQAYSSVNPSIEMSPLSKEAIDQILTAQQNIEGESYKGSAVYGPNLIDEVVKYNRIAASVASSLDFDVIHCHDWLTFGAGMIAKQISGKPLVSHVHATEFDRSPGLGNEDVKKLESLGCQYSDRIFAVSQFTKNILVNNYGIDHRKIEVVHNGIDMNGPPSSPRGVGSTAPKILFLGRVTYQKGPNYFVEAAHRVLQMRPDAQFVIAGSGDMVDYLKGRTAELGILDKVTFTGVLKEDEVKEIYKSVDCFVLSSVSEPFGLTVLEALSHRLPVIISKQAGVGEVLRHVLRYDFWDVDKLASLILSVITYPSLAQELQDRACDDLYPVTWDQVATKVFSIYERVVLENYAARV